MNKETTPYFGIKLSAGVLNSVDETLTKVDIATAMEKPIFRIASTNLTYRSVATLQQNNLLPVHVQESKGGWRLFSIKDYVYMLLINELRSFGASTDQIRKIKEIFYSNSAEDATRAICATLGKIEIVLLMYSNGNIYVCDADNASYLEAVENEYNSFIKINVNKFVDQAYRLGGFEPMASMKESAAARHMRMDLEPLTIKESKALDIIRDQAYREIIISKESDGELDLVKGMESYSANQLTTAELNKIISEIPFGRVRILKRDGRTVNVEREVNVKL